LTLVDLLSRGYFPKELPNPFTSTLFAQAVTGVGINLPGQFAVRRRRNGGGLPISNPARYSLARGGLLRRALSVPNPVNQHALSAEMVTEWADLGPLVAGTAFSATSPVWMPSGRAIQGRRHQRLRPVLSAVTRRNNRYVLKTDISRFYHSIYAHSIPWAVHTKAFAKQNRGLTHLGNRLDALVRAGQDQQTVGIPIGPDTSLVIAELLMQACDRELRIRIPGVRGHRFIDDYELGFRDRTDAENAYHTLESILAQFELALNPLKTSIVELPAALESTWTSKLSRHEFRATAQGQRVDLIDYFNVAYDLYRSNPGASVLQYAVGRVRYLDILPPNWRLFCTLLLDCAVPEPAALPYVLEIIINKVNQGAVCPTVEMGNALNTIVEEHSAIGHTSEVAWSLWACLALGIGVESNAAAAVVTCDNPFVALLALHADQAGLVPAGLDTTLWGSHMTQDALYGEHWILAYEANVKGWLPSVDPGDHVAADANFAFLKTAGVSFYDVNAAVGIAQQVPLPNVPSLTLTGVVDYD